jgi:hypothetical protein
VLDLPCDGGKTHLVLEPPRVPPPLLAEWGARTAIAIAVIAAVGSLIATIVGQILARRTSRELAERTTKLEQEGKERDARRDYEYEAKKRLYEECEPLLFQTVELVENARDRIASIARSCRSRDLEADGSGWLAQPPGYYFTSTAFQLLAPITSFKIVQRRLTVIDLSLEPQIREQYEILKLLFLSFTRDFDLAGREPVLRYDPDRADPDEPHRVRLLSEEPAVFGRQGLYRGTLDVVVDALIRTVGQTSEDGKGGTERCKTFGEFLAEFEAAGSPVDRIRPELDELFVGFHPQRRPVLWRVLVAQALLYDAFLGVRSDLGELASHLDCQGADTDETAEDTATTLRTASSYVEPELARIKGLVTRAF